MANSLTAIISQHEIHNHACLFNTVLLIQEQAQIISTNPPMNTAPAKKITVSGFIFAGSKF